MGSYTTFSINFTLRPDAPTKVKGIVRHMLHLDGVKEPCIGWDTSTCPNLAWTPPEFAGCERWEHMLSWYPVEERVFEEKPDGVRVRANNSSIKNYDGEIEKFAAWIAHHCVPQHEPILEATHVSDGEGRPWRAFSDGTRQFRNPEPDLPHWIAFTEVEIDTPEWGPRERIVP